MSRENELWDLINSVSSEATSFMPASEVLPLLRELQMRRDHSFVIEWGAPPDCRLLTPYAPEVRCRFQDAYAVANISPMEFPLPEDRKKYIEDMLKRRCLMQFGGLV